MPYIQTTYIAGNTIEVHKTYSARYGKKTSRSKNHSRTPEAVKRYNEQVAERELRLILNENFRPKDYYITFTYRRGERPDPDTAKKQLRKFIRQVRTLYAKDGKELYWVAVTEYKNKAIHHHMILNRHNIGKIIELWPYGRAHIQLLGNTGDYAQLAAYLIKETCKTFGESDNPNKKRWSCSRNLRKPKKTVTVVKADTWRDDPRPKKGYQIVKDSVYYDVNPFTGYPYQIYRMVKPPDWRDTT